ncbi:hypothetical protein [Bdellovibrio svalbardensis]|uniref:CDP-diacylglycerol--glycerol-3-phosphate 3-phosphatidyltransferase n=1 Tax=Bdellovibrio svalbardensis TaxID=2972972 RepID=A0ABT6DJZ3_9BACT|nr:hypothetical protein [Bdellovibrio svalbardensis]MDG0817123.1 hypothetical protein [Bdellovibrio svalbardensis]
MDIGLYLLKYPFRKVIGFLLPACENVDPNKISYALMPVGILMAAVYYYAMTGGPDFLFIVGGLLGLVRMVVATLDGLVAVHYKKSTVLGDILNRITPELCDMILIPTLVITKGLYPLGAFVLLFAWAVPFFGLFGAPSGLAVQSVGPVGQTDRLAALMLCSLFQFFSIRFNWGLDFILYFFYWVIIGGTITLMIRFTRVYKEAAKKDRGQTS